MLHASIKQDKVIIIKRSILEGDKVVAFGEIGSKINLCIKGIKDLREVFAMLVEIETEWELKWRELNFVTEEQGE